MAMASGGIYQFFRKNLIGLKDLHIVSLIPFPASNIFLVLLLDAESATKEGGGEKEATMNIISPTGESIGGITMSAFAEGESDGEVVQKFILNAVSVSGVYNEPGEYKVTRSVEGNQLLIGRFFIQYVPALPLTPERIRAIKSDPRAAKYVRYMVSCAECKKELKVACGIDRDKSKDAAEYIWYADLPERFKCDCGKLDLDLKYLRESLHVVLGYRPSTLTDNAQITERTYTQGALEKIANEFEAFLNKKDVLEEEIQKFIENNPIILGLFSAMLLKYKAPATAKYKTDFALVNTKDELVLIEIEKPNTKLFKEDGGQHSELTAAFDQVESWLASASRNRLGILDDVGIEGISIDKITNIRGVVIAGRRDAAYTQHLGKLLTRNIDFFTFDDLLDSLRLQIRNYNEI